MKVELPEFKRCCCCVPLRYGLLTMGYLRLLTTLPILAAMIFMIVFAINLYTMMGVMWAWEIFISVFMTTLVLLDTAFNILFLVGGHQKSVKLLRVFYVYSIVTFIIMSIGLVVTCLMQVVTNITLTQGVDHRFVYSTFIIYGQALATVVNIALGVYFILLQRSEIRKLSNNCNFRFVNHEADELTKCTIEVDNIDTTAEKIIENDK